MITPIVKVKPVLTTKKIANVASSSIPPISKIADTGFSYANLCLIYPPRVIKNEAMEREAREVLAHITLRVETCLAKEESVNPDLYAYEETLLVLLASYKNQSSAKA
jgi:hypothetical protein